MARAQVEAELDLGRGDGMLPIEAGDETGTHRQPKPESSAGGPAHEAFGLTRRPHAGGTRGAA